jgi:hypothetical protein
MLHHVLRVLFIASMAIGLIGGFAKAGRTESPPIIIQP